MSAANPTATTVLIIGAGPVGLAMAAELARYGVAVRIVERAAQRTDKSKALVVWSRTLELMGPMGCSAAFLAAGRKVTAADILAGGRPIARITFDGVPTPYPFALMLPQSDTERLLEEHLKSLGIPVERNVELMSFVASGDHTMATLHPVNGETASLQDEVVAATWLIGCDGAHSTVRHTLGIQFSGETLTSDWVLADVHLRGERLPDAITTAWHAEGALAIFPIAADRYRIIADVSPTPNSSKRADPTLEDVNRLLEQRGPGGLSAVDPVWLAAFHINERKVADYRAGSIFLAGDAAHVHSPAGGQGMNTGIQDACNLAWKLALVCRGICRAEPLLGSYSAERSAVGEQVLREAGQLTAIAILRGPAKQAIRNRAAKLLFGLAAVREKAAETLTEVSIGYHYSPLSVSTGRHPAPEAGTRAPLREAQAEGVRGDSPRFTLCANPSQNATDLLLRYPQLVDSRLRPPYSEGGLWLVRPDGYVGLAAREADWISASRYLDAIAI